MSDGCAIRDFFLKIPYPLLQARISDGRIVLRCTVNESCQDPEGELRVREPAKRIGMTAEVDRIAYRSLNLISLGDIFSKHPCAGELETDLILPALRFPRRMLLFALDIF